MDRSGGPGVRANGPVSPPSSPTGSPVGPPLTPLIPVEDEQQSSLGDVAQMWIKFAKTFAVIFPIYILGYFGFSFSWVLIGLATLFYWRRNYGEKDYRINRALAYLDHEEKAVKQNVTTAELPPWVHYPDVERVEWLNKTVKQMWPFICQFVDKLFRETIEPAVKSANPYLSSFCFSKIDMGDKPMRVNGVKVYTDNVDKRQVIMDVQISFVGNTSIDVDIKKFYCRAGIKSIQLHGVMRVVMEPLLGDMPLIGALSVFFLKKPLLDINWTGLTNMLDIPGLNGLCDNIIQDIICGFLVLPNAIKIPLVGEAELAQLRFPLPKAVLRIHLTEAQDLLSKDKMLGGLIKGKSDPYGVVQVGTQVFQSKVIHETLNPKWNEVYEALVYDHSGPNIGIELFDEDPDKDDFLGSMVINLSELQKEQKIDEWFVLEEVSSGKLHLKVEWLSLLSSPEMLDQVLVDIKADQGRAKDGLSSALLVVFLDSARNLPCNPLEFHQTGLRRASVSKTSKSGKKVTSEPSPLVQFRVGHKSFESKTRYKTSEPVWEEAFTFLIHNPKTQELEVEVRDEKHECTLGTLILPLTRLLEAEEMTLNQQFPLKTSGPSCSVKMKMALRVLCQVQQAPSNPDPSPAQTAASNPPVPSPRSAVPSPRSAVASDPPASPGTIAYSYAYADANADEIPRSSSVSAQDLLSRHRNAEDPVRAGKVEGRDLSQAGKSVSSMVLSDAPQQHHHHQAGGKEPTPSIASDISNPYATQELHQRLQLLHNGSGTYFPLGEIQLTLRHSSHRNKLIVLVHSCRNLIAFTDQGSDPYVRLYLLPDKRRSGRRKTHTYKKTLNPVYDQTFEFSVSLVELHRRTLDVAVKNSGLLFSKHRGLLGKVLVELTHGDIVKGWTKWYELTEDGLPKSPQI